METTAVSHFLYRVFKELPPLGMSFPDQFAFRPTELIKAALVAILHTVTHLFSTNPYVIVISLDFSKAFDTVTH